MPADAAALVRAAWEPVARDATCVVHGDPNPGNAIVDGERLGLIDWDEARVDVPAFDLAALGDAPEAFVTAGIAWEAAACWRAEPEYASRRFAELRDRMQRSR